MVLTDVQHAGLRKHYDDSPEYLAHALFDLVVNRENCKSIDTILVDHQPFIGNSIDFSDELRLKTAYKLIGDEVKSTYRTVAERVSTVAWQFLVMAGRVPQFFEEFKAKIQALAVWITAPDEIPEKIRISLFSQYAQYFKEYAERFYSHVKDLLKRFTEIPAFIDQIFSVAVSTLQGLLKLIGLGVYGFVNVAAPIVNGVLNTVLAFSTVLAKATAYMTYCGMTLVESYTNQKKDLQRFSAKVALFLYSASQEHYNYEKELSNEQIRNRISSFCSELATAFQNAASDFINADVTALTQFFSTHWLGKNIITFTTNIVSWVIDNISWLVSTIVNFLSIGRYVYEAAMAQAPTLFTVVFPKLQKTLIDYGICKEPQPLFDAETPQDHLTGEAAVDQVAKLLEKYPETPEDVRAKLKRVNDERDKLRTNVRSRMKEARTLQMTLNIWNSTWQAADELSKWMVGDAYDGVKLLDAYKSIVGVDLADYLAAEKNFALSQEMSLFEAMNKTFNLTDETDKIIASIVATQGTQIGNEIDYRDTTQTYTKRQLKTLTTDELILRKERLTASKPIRDEQIVTTAKVVQQSGTIRQLVLNKQLTTGVARLSQITSGGQGDVTPEQQIATGIAAYEQAAITNTNTVTNAMLALQGTTISFEEEFVFIDEILSEREGAIRTHSSFLAALVIGGIYVGMVAYFDMWESPQISDANLALATPLTEYAGLLSNWAYNIFYGGIEIGNLQASQLSRGVQAIFSGAIEIAIPLIPTIGSFFWPFVWITPELRASNFAAAMIVFGSFIWPAVSFSYDITRVHINVACRSWGVWEDNRPVVAKDAQLREISGYWSRSSLTLIKRLSTKALIKLVSFVAGVFFLAGAYAIPKLGKYLSGAVVRDFITNVREWRKITKETEEAMADAVGFEEEQEEVEKDFRSAVSTGSSFSGISEGLSVNAEDVAEQFAQAMQTPLPQIKYVRSTSMVVYEDPDDDFSNI